MAFSEVAVAAETKTVGMGKVAVAGEHARLTAVLGSCIGVAVHHLRSRRGALAHVVLPDSDGRATAPGKFADTAVPYILSQLGVPPTSLTAKIVGGARMFGTKGPMQIGETNIKAVVEALDKAGVRLAARDVGGRSGRRIALDCETGELTVETVGNPPKTL